MTGLVEMSEIKLFLEVKIARRLKLACIVEVGYGSYHHINLTLTVPVTAIDALGHFETG